MFWLPIDHVGTEVLAGEVNGAERPVVSKRPDSLAPCQDASARKTNVDALKSGIFFWVRRAPVTLQLAHLLNHVGNLKPAAVTHQTADNLHAGGPAVFADQRAVVPEFVVFDLLVPKLWLAEVLLSHLSAHHRDPL